MVESLQQMEATLSENTEKPIMAIEEQHQMVDSAAKLSVHNVIWCHIYIMDMLALARLAQPKSGWL